MIAKIVSREYNHVNPFRKLWENWKALTDKEDGTCSSPVIQVLLFPLLILGFVLIGAIQVTAYLVWGLVYLYQRISHRR
jgi:hypothetical protein